MYLILKKTYISHRTGSIYSIHWIERSYPFVNVRLHVCVDIACFLICFACEMTCVLIHDGGGRKFFFLWLCCYCSASAPEKKTDASARKPAICLSECLFYVFVCANHRDMIEEGRKNKSCSRQTNHIYANRKHIYVKSILKSLKRCVYASRSKLSYIYIYYLPNVWWLRSP